MNTDTPIPVVDQLLLFLIKNISPSALRMLRLDGKPVGEFRKLTGCSTANVSHLCKNLEKEGLAQFEPDLEDPRRRVIRATPKGKALMIEADAIVA